MTQLADTLLQELLNDGCTIDILYEDEYDLRDSTDYGNIIETIKSVDNFSRILARKDGKYVASFVLSLDDEFTDEETVIDYRVNDYAEAIYKKALDKGECEEKT